MLGELTELNLTFKALGMQQNLSVFWHLWVAFLHGCIYCLENNGESCVYRPIINIDKSHERKTDLFGIDYYRDNLIKAKIYIFKADKIFTELAFWYNGYILPFYFNLQVSLKGSRLLVLLLLLWKALCISYENATLNQHMHKENPMENSYRRISISA